jgi:hypothetical protein
MVCDVLGLHTLSGVGIGIGTSSIDWVQVSRFYLKMEPESSLQNIVFLNKNRTMDKVQEHKICINVPLSPTFRFYYFLDMTLLSVNY